MDLVIYDTKERVSVDMEGLETLRESLCLDGWCYVNRREEAVTVQFGDSEHTFHPGEYAYMDVNICYED